MLELMTSTMGTCQKCESPNELIVLACHYASAITGRALFLCRNCLMEHRSHILTVTTIHAGPVQLNPGIAN
jgi:hypothetical protein